MTDIVVAHLVRYRNGFATFHRFLHSYTRTNAGVPHRLVFILKGFGGQLEEPFRSAIRSVQCETVHVADRGLDIASYFQAARQVMCRYVCFLNSFSEIRGHDWLAHLISPMSDPRIGLVGASGTWQSLKTNFLRAHSAPAIGPLDRLIRLAKLVRYGLELRPSFPDFPNPHVRTNAFLLEREQFLRFRPPGARKLDNYRFESGITGLSRTLSHAGLGLRVVGRNGRAYAPDEWRDSQTFWTGKQENLLVADNQSNLYEKADPAMRARLRTYAWGIAD